MIGEDRAVVFPQMYRENRLLYDKIVDIAYIIKDYEDPDGELDWCWQGGLKRVTEKATVAVLARVFVVRIRLPWNESSSEWYVDKYELYDNRDKYQIINAYLRVRLKDQPGPMFFMDTEDIDDTVHDIVDVQYLVTLRDDKPIESVVDRDTLYTVHAK